MKHVKDLKVTTKEGFSVMNLERFPSMEYGDNGGVRADLYYKGDKIMTVYDAGNGGCAIAYTNELYSLKTWEIKTKALELLKRADENFNKFDFLKNKTAKDIDDDDFLAIVNLIEERYDDYKQVDKALKSGFKCVAVLSNDFSKSYLRYRVSDVTVDEVNSYLIDNNLAKKYKDITIYKDTKSVATI